MDGDLLDATCDYIHEGASLLVDIFQVVYSLASDHYVLYMDYIYYTFHITNTR